MSPNESGKLVENRHPIGPGVRALNPHLFRDAQPPEPPGKCTCTPTALGHNIACPAFGPSPKKIRQRRRVMNRTETEFAAMLDRQKAAGEIVDWSFEGITLRYGRTDVFQYTPDFVTYRPMPGYHKHVRITCIEVKGSKIFDRAINQFKQARDAHPYFEFEFHQKQKDGTWNRLA